jgi:hypothetical protein
MMEENKIFSRRKLGSPKHFIQETLWVSENLQIYQGELRVSKNAKFLKYSSWRPIGFLVEMRW